MRRWWLILLPLFGSIAAEECQRDFFAQPVVYDRAMVIDIYYTAINLQSAAACASFCGDRHFCRTAVYNAIAKTCAISYEYTLNCRYNNKRVKEFDTRNSSSQLVQIACVTKCNEPSGRVAQKHKILAGEPEELQSVTPATLKKVQLITGEPNDGLRSFPARLARNRPRDIPREDGFVNKLVIENISSGGILPVLDERHMVRRKGQICYRLREKKYLMGAAYETHKDVSLQTCRCLCAHSYGQNSIFMCKSFNWRADGTCELNGGNHMGRHDLIDDNRYTYQFIDCDIQVLMGIANRFCTKEGLAISSTSSTTTTTEAPSTTTTSETSTTSTTVTEPPTTTQLTTSVTNPSESTSSSTSPTTSEASSTGTETTTSEATSSTVRSITSAEEKAGFFVPSRKEGGEEEVVGDSTLLTTTEGTSTVKEEGSELTKRTEAVTTEGTTSVESSTATELTTSVATTETVTETAEGTSTTPSEADLSIEKSACFERIAGHMMGSVAAALEHDVSLEECECFCANSRASGRHGFDCSSATYYHGERDCVLNLEDRHQKRKYFAKQADFNVTYLGLTCTREKAIESLVSPDKTYGCRATPKVYKPKKKAIRGAFSDACFEELPSHVLEGTALHVETNATPQQCKCLCASAEQKFNESCQSFQYYYEGAVCLLSKNNRFSNPEKFSHLPDQLLRSYFEYKCASQEEKLKKYSEQLCLFQKAIDDAPSQKSNSTSSDQTSRPLTILEGTNSTDIEGSGNPKIEGSGDGGEGTTVSMSTTEITTTTEVPTTVTTTTTAAPTTTKKQRTRRPINKAIPEAEGLEESDFEDLEGILSNNLEDPTTPVPPPKVHGVKTVKFTDKVDKAVQEDSTSTTVTKPPTTQLTTIATKPSTTTRRTTTTTTPKEPEYPSAGKCTYSALYQTAFFGRRTIKTVHVKTAADCFAACFALRCRSANLIAQGALNQCELFRDSLIDYRRPDMIGYDGSTVYFDGIRCDGI